MPGYSFEMEGWDRLKAQMKFLESNVRVAMAQAGWRGGEAISTRAHDILVENEHVISGNLKDSLHPESKWISPTVLDIEVGTNVFYAPYVEALPDGGYLYRAAHEKINEVYDYIFAEWTKLLMGMP